MKLPDHVTDWDEIIDRWLTEAYAARNCSATTMELRRAQIRRLVRAHPDRSIWELTPDEIAEWVNNIHQGVHTRIATRSGVRSFYQWARRRGFVDTDPTDELIKPPTPQPRPRPVPNDVYADVLARADPRMRVALRLAGELGLRRAEVARIARENVVVDGEMHWLRFVGKGDKERVIPCPEGLAHELLALIDSSPGDYAFPTYGDPGHITPHWMGMLISRLLPDGLTMHKLRHRAGTEAYRRSGNDIYLASKLLGHSTVTTTQVYVQLDDSRLRSVIEGIGV